MKLLLIALSLLSLTNFVGTLVTPLESSSKVSKMKNHSTIDKTTLNALYNIAYNGWNIAWIVNMDGYIDFQSFKAFQPV